MSSKKGKQKKAKKSQQDVGGAMGGVPLPDDLELNLDRSVTELESTVFDDLSAMLTSIPGFNDKSELEAMRNDPCAMFNTPGVTIEKVLKLIELDVASEKVQYLRMEYLRVSIGTFRLGRAELGFPSELIICQYGITFNIRHTNRLSGLAIKACIPITDIMSFRIYNGKKMCVIGVSSGSAHAEWLRTALGMDDDPEVIELRKTENLSAAFYSPLLGGKEHQWITLMIETLSEAEFSKLTTLFLHSEGKEFICEFTIMDSKEAHEYVLSAKIFESK